MWLAEVEGNIAIDGPAGAGKSTVARMLAARLGFLYVDTGAMYRALTLKALRVGINVADEEATGQLAAETQVELGGGRVYCDGEDVTEFIRSPQVSDAVSLVARSPRVRERMGQLQRAIAAGGRVVMDGRDIGSCVLPGARYKFFLTASLEERARRRAAELARQGYRGLDLAEVTAELARRDAMDAGREVAPLVQAQDAVWIDTTALGPAQVLERILQTIQEG